MQLFKAHEQWKTRPADERFQSVQAMHDACSAYRAQAAVAKVPYSQLRVEAVGTELAITGKANVPATLSNWAMGQLSARAGAPASYLRTLPATLAAQNLNHGLKERAIENDKDGAASLMFHQNGSLILRAATSDRYSRIWNSEITARLLQLQAANPNWKNPLGYARGEFGAELVPSGLYASDHDMFAFLVDESRTLKGSPMGINRGFFIWNSEVGASSFGVMTFLYDRVCGNNIVWGASKVDEIRVRHVGGASHRAFSQLALELRRYSESSAREIEGTIEKARNLTLGATKQQTLDAIMGVIAGRRIADLPEAKVLGAIELAETRTERYGSPYTAWGVVSGLTEASQAEPYANVRMKTDRAAGKLLKTLVF